MSNGLFTSGSQLTVEQLLQQRAKRDTDLQRQLMASAAQGARDPMRAKAASFLGSTLGRALAGVHDDPQMEKAKAAEESQAALVKQYAIAAGSDDPQVILSTAKQLMETGDPQAINMGGQLIQRADALKSQQATAYAADQKQREADLESRVAAESLQMEAQKLSGQLQEFDPRLSAALGSDNANPELVSKGYTALETMRKEQESDTTFNKDVNSAVASLSNIKDSNMAANMIAVLKNEPSEQALENAWSYMEKHMEETLEAKGDDDATVNAKAWADFMSTIDPDQYIPASLDDFRRSVEKGTPKFELLRMRTELSATAEKELNSAQASVFSARKQIASVHKLIKKVDKLDLQSGVFARTKDAWDEFWGTQGEQALLRKEFDRIKNSQVIGNLPAGVASDRDIALIMKGFPEADTETGQLKEWLESFSRVQSGDAEYHRFKAAFISRQNNSKGFISAWDTYTKLTPAILKIYKEGLANPPEGNTSHDVTTGFIKEYGFDPRGLF